jgi:hypothetical protein
LRTTVAACKVGQIYLSRIFSFAIAGGAERPNEPL